MPTLTLTRPSHTPRGTIYLPGERHDPTKQSPFTIAGLPTQWDRVYSHEGGDVVEIACASQQALVGDLPVVRTIAAGDPVANLKASLVEAASTGPRPGSLSARTPARAIRAPRKYVPRDLTLAFTPDATSVVLSYSSGANETTWDGYAITRKHRWQTVTVGGQVLGVHSWWQAGAYDDYAVLTIALVSTGRRHYFDGAVLTGDQWAVFAGPRTDAPPIVLVKTVAALGEGSPLNRHTIQTGNILIWRLVVGPGAQRVASQDLNVRGNLDGFGSIKDAWQDLAVGGFLPQGVPVADLSHVPNLAPTLRSQLQSALLSLQNATADPLWGGSTTPPSKLYPCRGAKYFGATGGVDREKEKGADLAATGNCDLYDTYLIEQVREIARSPGHRIYDTDGSPHDPFVEGDTNEGPPDYRMITHMLQSLNYGTYSGPLKQYWEEKTGQCPYEASLGDVTGIGMGSAWDPHDEQHIDRAVGQEMALGFLANDPTAWWLLRSEAMLAGRAYFNDENGRTTAFDGTPGFGTQWGRAWAQIATLLACVRGRMGVTPAEDDEVTAAGIEGWLSTYWNHLQDAQMVTGLFGFHDDGSKVSTGDPFGHKLSEDCRRDPDLHTLTPGNNTAVSDWFAGRGPEQLELMSGLRSVFSLLGTSEIPAMLSACGMGLQEYAWRRLTSYPVAANKADQRNGTVLGRGVVDRYPVSLGDEDLTPFGSRQEVPDDCADAWNDPVWVPSNGGAAGDDHRVGQALFSAIAAGGTPPIEAFYGFCASGAGPATSLTQALTNLKARGLNNINNFSSLLALVQKVVAGL